MASVRFICGTQTLHTALEAGALGVPRHRGHDPVLLLLRRQRRRLRDPLRRARTRSSPTSSTTPRSSTASACPRPARYRYRNADMADLEAQLVAAADARRRVIVTDGVFSMDGYLAPLDRICDLAERYDALVMVDDSHAVGFVGPGGRGTPEHFGVMDRVDILTGTLGKALGGASGGYVAGAPGDRRPAAPARPALPVLQRGRARRSRPAPGSPSRSPPTSERGPRDAAPQHRAVPRADDRGRLRDPAGRAPDHPGDVPRRGRRPGGVRGSPTRCWRTAST